MSLIGIFENRVLVHSRFISSLYTTVKGRDHIGRWQAHVGIQGLVESVVRSLPSIAPIDSHLLE